MCIISSRLLVFPKIYSQVRISRRLIVSCRILYKSTKSFEPVKERNVELSSPKVIDATLVSPTKKSQTLFYLRSLSARHKLLAVCLQSPIAIVEWIESSVETKKKSLINIITRLVFCFLLFSFVALGFIIYLIEEHEITKRLFCNFLYNENFITNYEGEKLKRIMKRYEGRFSSDSALIQRCDEITHQIIKSNKEFVQNEDFNLAWSTAIIDTGSELHVELIGTSKFLIISKALVELCQNDHQLAYIISHSLAHFLLKHNREPLSNLKPYQLWTGFRLFYYFRFYNYFMPGQIREKFDESWMKSFNTLDRKAGNFWLDLYERLEMSLNFSDVLEEEADRIALQLLARSCYDIREVDKFVVKGQEMIKQLVESEKQQEKCRYLLQHSFNQNKITSVGEKMDKFIQFRSICGCPDLK